MKSFFLPACLLVALPALIFSTALQRAWAETPGDPVATRTKSGECYRYAWDRQGGSCGCGYTLDDTDCPKGHSPRFKEATPCPNFCDLNPASCTVTWECEPIKPGGASPVETDIEPSWGEQ